MKTMLVATAIASGVLAAGLAILVFAAALAFENGMIADATGGVGSVSPVEYAMWLGGLALTLIGGVGLPIALRRPMQSQPQ